MENTNFFHYLADMLNVSEEYFTLFVVLFVIYLIVLALLKGLSLWRSARNSQTVWFWVMVFVQTSGVLEIVYLLTNRDQSVAKKVAASEAKEDSSPFMSGTPSGETTGFGPQGVSSDSDNQ